MTSAIIFKIGVIIGFLLVLYNLTKALLLLVRKPHDSRQVAKSITWRLALSISVLALLIFAYVMGWVTPNPRPI